MRCSDFEQRIALYVEEDLPVDERGRVEAHLQECSKCWDLAQDLKESQAVFKSIRHDIPDATALSVLRERVMTELNGTEATTWFDRLLSGGLRGKAALAGITLILVGSSALWLIRTPHSAPVVPAPVSLVPAPVVVAAIPEPQPAAPAPHPVRRRPRRPAPAAPASGESKQVAIKFLTDDPNIIIYWLVDEKGE